MKDKEIIKALECCTAEGFVCSGCPYETLETQGVEYTEYDCSWYLRVDALDLIIRQQAEIERCHKEFEELNVIEEQERKETLENAKRNSDLFMSMVEYAKAEGIKEFGERLKERIADIGNLSVSEYLSVATDIDDLEREMAGGRAK